MDNLAICSYAIDIGRAFAQWYEIKRPNTPLSGPLLADRIAEVSIAIYDALSLVPLPKESANTLASFSGIFRTFAIGRSIYLLVQNAPGLDKTEQCFKIALHLINVGRIAVSILTPSRTPAYICFQYAEIMVRIYKIFYARITLTTVDVAARYTLEMSCHALLNYTCFLLGQRILNTQGGAIQLVGGLTLLCGSFASLAVILEFRDYGLIHHNNPHLTTRQKINRSAIVCLGIAIAVSSIIVLKKTPPFSVFKAIFHTTAFTILVIPPFLIGCRLVELSQGRGRPISWKVLAGYSTSVLTITGIMLKCGLI